MRYYKIQSKCFNKNFNLNGCCYYKVTTDNTPFAFRIYDKKYIKQNNKWEEEIKEKDLVIKFTKKEYEEDLFINLC